jgi:hypothetical protein
MKKTKTKEASSNPFSRILSETTSCRNPLAKSKGLPIYKLENTKVKYQQFCSKCILGA